MMTTVFVFDLCFNLIDQQFFFSLQYYMSFSTCERSCLLFFSDTIHLSNCDRGPKSFAT